MREILITPECLEFIDNQNDRISTKFYQIIEVIGDKKGEKNIERLFISLNN